MQLFLTKFLWVAKLTGSTEACQSSHDKCMTELNYNALPPALESYILDASVGDGLPSVIIYIPNDNK